MARLRLDFLNYTYLNINITKIKFKIEVLIVFIYTNKIANNQILFFFFYLNFH